MLLRLNRRINKANVELENKNEVITKQKEEITAQRDEIETQAGCTKIGLSIYQPWNPLFFHAWKQAHAATLMPEGQQREPRAGTEDRSRKSRLLVWASHVLFFSKFPSSLREESGYPVVWAG